MAFPRLTASASAVAASLALVSAPVSSATIAPRATPAPKLVSAANVQSVIDYLASKGDTVTQSTGDDGKLTLTESGNHYHVYFYDCSEAKDQCKTLQFQACYAGYAQGNVTKTNDWTSRYIMVKAYVDANNYVCIEEPVSTGIGGVSYEALDGTFDTFLWFRQNADTQFK